MQTRREMLTRSAPGAGALTGLGLLPHAAQAACSQAAFDAKTMGDLMKALGTSGPAESKDVTITGPDIAENGAVVPVGASTTLAGAKRILLLVEKNPSMLAALFEVTEAVWPTISTRLKMAQSSIVIAVVISADNKVLFAQKETKVTLGGCGG